MNLTIVFIIAIFILAVFIFIDPIAQAQSYYLFADSTTYLGIPNCLNVISNIPFFIVGLYGLYAIKNKQIKHDNCAGIPIYLFFFLGVLLTSFGSAWFHLNPSDDTLVWDRLPITISFMALTTALLSEYIGRGIQKIFYPLLIIGIGSVMYWHITEQMGRGDLRPYVLVQFLPIIIIPIVALLKKSQFTHEHYLIGVIVFYLLAKVAEHFDQAIAVSIGFVSGHTLKHLLAAVACYLVLQMLLHRDKR